MLRQLTYYVFSVLFILTFSKTNILVEALCFSSQKSCFTYSPYYRTWCCESYETCGSTYNDCNSNSSSSVIIYVIIGVCIFVTCVCIAICKQCCYQAQRGPSTNGYRYCAPVQQPLYAQQQQSVRRTPVVTYANPSAYVHNPAPIHNVREDIPPSYDAITRDTRYNAPVPFMEPPYPSYQGANLRV